MIGRGSGATVVDGQGRTINFAGSNAAGKDRGRKDKAKRNQQKSANQNKK
jgi:hypothetical protein